MIIPDMVQCESVQYANFQANLGTEALYTGLVPTRCTKRLVYSIAKAFNGTVKIFMLVKLFFELF
jgi:hypothetical protein